MAPRQAPGTREAPPSRAAAATAKDADDNFIGGGYTDPALPPKVPNPEEFSFLGHHFEGKPLLERLNYLHLTLLTATPLLGLYGLLTWDFNWATAAWAVSYYFITGIGITAGYHRLFAHRAYKAHPILEWFLICAGSGAVEGSCKWWSRDHRAHHRHVDTKKDPYSSHLGFWHAHIGWMLCKQDKSKIGRADITDLKEKWSVNFQHRNYPWFVLAFGFVLPTLVAGLLWGDYYGGFFIAGVGRLVFVHHSTFCVNSLAHWAGEQTYTDGHTARNSWITALVTIGEGFHNFHHEFPSDYRNGVRWHEYDPTKWFIRTMEMCGLAFDLTRFSINEIQKGMLQMRNKALQDSMKGIFWGPDPAVLPTYTLAEVQRQVKEEGKLWTVVEGYVVDVDEFLEQHPGGRGILKAYLGKDATEAFEGEVYRHSNAGHNLARTMRVGRLVGDKKED